MAVTVQSSDLSLDALLELVRKSEWPESTRIMAFSVAQTSFTFLRGANDDLIRVSEQGRIFHSGGELRWRVVEGGIRAVYLGDEGLVGLEDAADALQGLVPRQRVGLLWGERTDLEPEWLERQVPHVLRYPFQGGKIARGRLAIRMEEWVDGEGIVRFARYMDLEEREV
jgi:hypothetical protein